MLPGPRLTDFSIFLPLAYNPLGPLVYMVVRVSFPRSLSSFIFFPSAYRSQRAVGTYILLHLFVRRRVPSSSSTGFTSREPRREVSRRASWWLHRWLLASLEALATHRVCPPRVKELPREQVHLLLLLLPSMPRCTPSSLLLSFLLLFVARPSLSPPFHLQPPYAPSGSYLRVLLIFSYYRLVGMRPRLTHSHALPRGVIGTRTCGIYTRCARWSSSGPVSLPPTPLLLGSIFFSVLPAVFFELFPLLSALLGYSNMWAHYYSRNRGKSKRTRGFSRGLHGTGGSARMGLKPRRNAHALLPAWRKRVCGTRKGV